MWLAGTFWWARRAWVATPWALAGYSWPLGVLPVVLLLGLPTVFATP